MGQAVLFSDFSKATPSGAIAPHPRPGCWRVCEYTSGDIEGRLLYAADAQDTPNLTLPLNLRGWHRVTIGVWGDCFSLRHTYAPSGNRVKLSGDPCFRAFERDRTPPPDSISIEDFEVACADLTGQDLVIAPPKRHSGATTALAYVRCEPLSDREVAELQADRQNGGHRRLIAYNDGVGFVTSGEYRDRQDIWELVEPYRHSDVESLYWGVIGTATTFPVTTGRMLTAHDGPAMGVQGHESFATLDRRGINALTTAMEYAQGMGLSFRVYQRMGAWAMTFPHDSPTATLCREHPEWRCVSRDGIPTSSLSYAFGEVRRHQVEFLAEIASWGADGIDLNFLRGPPFVGYEEPLVSGFQREYGEDPRTLDEWDDRWLRHRCRALTAFVRELRAELDAVGSKAGRRISLSADTFALPAGNLYYGLDVAAWVGEGLLDRLHPWGKIRGQPPVDMTHYRALVGGSRTELWPHLRVWDDGTDAAYDAYRTEALSLYDAGAAGLAIWDACNLDGKSVKGPLQRRLGHADELRAALAAPRRPELALGTIETLGLEHLGVVCVPETHPERIMPDGYTKHQYMWHG
ncbi:MAG: hypothetical protein OXC31_28250 [Spirochaetaceae bacterium]|nr:hypothetical protein [Spirochaetaceae bacterium]